MDELDRLLASAAPRTSAANATLEEALRDVLLAPQPTTSPRRQRGRWITARAVGAAASLMAACSVGVGVAYASGWLLPTPQTGDWAQEPSAVKIDLALPDGRQCAASYILIPDSSKQSMVDSETWRRLWTANISYIRSVDPASLNSAAIRKRYLTEANAAQDQVNREYPGQSTPPPLTDEDVYTGAPAAELNARLRQHLEGLGLRTDLLISTSSHTCSHDVAKSNHE